MPPITPPKQGRNNTRASARDTRGCATTSQPKPAPRMGGRAAAGATGCSTPSAGLAFEEASSFCAWAGHEPLVVHLKGFARDLDFAAPATAALARAAVRRVVGMVERAGGAPGVLVWDGDSLDPASFSALVPRLHAACASGGHAVRLAAFLRRCDRGRFERSWGVASLPITVFLCPAELDWKELGNVALRATQARDVVCFGGGRITRAECEAADHRVRGEHVRFHVYPAERPAKRGTAGVERTTLLELRARLGC